MTPEELAAEQERSAEDLRRDAYLCGEFWDALKAAKIPDDLAGDLARYWYAGLDLPADGV